MSRKKVEIVVCRYCRARVRETTVIVGKPPGHRVKMMIDAEPHPDGRVIKRLDGQYRLLGDGSYRKPGVAGFRAHGRTMVGCGVQAAELVAKLRREIGR